MSSTLVDELFEIRELLKGEDTDQASAKLRQLIVKAERGAEKRRNASDPLAEQISKWLQLFLAEEYAAELSRQDKSRINIQEISQHVEERQQFLSEGLLVPPALSGIHRLCSLLGHVCKAQNLSEGVSELRSYLSHHLIMDESLRQEVANLSQSMVASLTSLQEITSNMGDDNSELNQARNILAEQLPEDPKAALAHLRRACDALASAEGKLGSAVKSITEQMKTNVQELGELRSHLEEAQKEARNDPLTGLANRRELRSYFDAMGDGPASLLMLDLDYFKKVNDTYGHDAGDEVLAEIGKRLSENTSEGDIVARIGGEEFVAVLTGVAVWQVLSIAEKIRQAVTEKAISTAAGEIPVTLSIGAASRFTKESISEWKKRADMALYEAKQNGRNCTRLSSV